MSTTRISVGGDYDVVIGTGLLDELPALVGEGVQRVLVIHPRALATTGEAVREDLRAKGFEAYAAEVPDAEEAKTAQVAAFLWGVLGQAGFTRSDAIVSVGGEATTDLAGFVAARYTGRSAEECVRYAVACGADSTQRLGAGIVDKREVERLLGEVEVSEIPVHAQVP